MKKISTLIAIVATIGIAAFARPASADDSLVQMLVSKLSVTDKQASGGAGALLGYAKQKLSKDDFGKVSAALPETDTLLKAAPKTDTASLASAAGAMGGVASDATGLAAVGNSFKKLGLSSDMVGKFLPVVTGYLQGKGKAGEAAAGLLSGVLTPSPTKAGTTTTMSEQPDAPPPQTK
jgi:hypothetical protein